MAPLSLVQAVIAGGLALLAIPARRWFGIALGRREVLGLVLSASGLAFLALTAGHGRPGRRLYQLDDARVRGRHARAGRRRCCWLGAASASIATAGLLLAAAAGTLLGVSDVALKALAETVGPLPSP